MVSIPDIELQEVIRSFAGRSFSTYDFIQILQGMFPSTYNALAAKYGRGGKGAGNKFSPYSRASQRLESLSNKGELDKLDYRPAPPNYGNRKIRYWAASTFAIGGQDFPDELPPNIPIKEGAKKEVTVNIYERNQRARLKCIRHWGIKCFICGFDFEEFYGGRGAGFIHVHHLTPLSEIQEEYELDPVNDLRPVCPNCHAMLHRSIPAAKIDQVNEMINCKNQLNKAK